MLRSDGVSVSPVVLRESEEAGGGEVSDCAGVLRATKYKTDWVRPHSAPASDQREREPEPPEPEQPWRL